MSVSVKIEVKSPKLSQAFSVLSLAGRRDLNEHMGISVRELTQRHLVGLAASRKNQFGAPSSDHFKSAAEAVERAPVEADAAGATLTINSVGLGRAFHDVTITPKAAKALTIPVCALAYARRAGEFDNLFVFKAKDGNSFLAMRDPTGGEIKLMYLLRRSVTQKQDRTLLPSEQEWEKAAITGARRYIQSLGN